VFSVAFVCLLAGLCKNYSIDFPKKLDEKVSHGPRKKLLDLGSNLDHVTLGLGLGLV